MGTTICTCIIQWDSNFQQYNGYYLKTLRDLRDECGFEYATLSFTSEKAYYKVDYWTNYLSCWRISENEMMEKFAQDAETKLTEAGAAGVKSTINFVSKENRVWVW